MKVVNCVPPERLQIVEAQSPSDSDHVDIDHFTLLSFVDVPILVSPPGSISSAAGVLSSTNQLERRERVVELPGRYWDASVPPACIRL